MVVRVTLAVGLLAVAGLAGCASTEDQAAPTTASAGSSMTPAVTASASASAAAPSPTGSAAAPSGGSGATSTAAGSPSSAGADDTPDADTDRAAPAPDSPQEPGFSSVAAAIEAVLQERGAEFAGPCDEAEPADVGRYCYVVLEDRGDEVVATVGQVYSEFDAYLLLRLGETGWQVVDSADYPYPDGGPLPF